MNGDSTSRTLETVDIHALLREYEAAVENREADERNQGTRGRVNRAAADLVTAVEGLRQSERYAWKNTREIDAERMRLLDQIEALKLARLGDCQHWEEKQRVANETISRLLSGKPEFPDETPARRSLQQQVMSFISAGVNTGLWNRDIAYDLVRQMLNARWNEASPRGKPCTCDNALGSSCACRVDAGERLGDLWYCRKRAESAEKAKAE